MTNSWRDTYSSKYLSSKDVPKKGKSYKILSVEEEIVNGKEGPKPKLVVELRNANPWILNVCNSEQLEEIFGTEDPDEWRGVVELYNDSTVRGPEGQKGGIRVRAATEKKTKVQDEEEDLDDDLDDLDDED